MNSMTLKKANEKANNFRGLANEAEKFSRAYWPKYIGSGELPRWVGNPQRLEA
jgi:hypothetical protein